MKALGAWLWESGGILVVFGVLGLAATVYLVLAAPAHPTSEQAERSARRWADTMGIKITGAQCDRDACVIATEQGRPIALWCGEASCSLRGEP